MNEVVFDKGDLLSTSPTFNPDLLRVNEQVLIDYIRKNDEENFGSKEAYFIVEELSKGTPSQPMIAKKLNLSSKTLQRRLKVENTHCKELLEQIHVELATRYLKNDWRVSVK